MDPDDRQELYEQLEMAEDDLKDAERLLRRCHLLLADDAPEWAVGTGYLNLVRDLKDYFNA